VSIVEVGRRPVVAPTRDRPSVGLVLGSGAARGFAHIGVIHALREHGIIPDIVVGTSMGALVGGCYANGQLEQLEVWARALTLRRIIGYLDVRIGSSGVIGGGRLARRLEQAIGNTSIEDLPVRFAAIATEVGTGHEIWLTRGTLALALRASYALPGIFPPVRLGGRWLMDGALVNPVPVSTARALGARVVIAVNLNGELTGRGSVVPAHGAREEDEMLPVERTLKTTALGAATSLIKRQLGFSPRRVPPRDPRVPGISMVMMDAFNITQDRISRSRLAGDPPDVMIGPKLGRIGLFDFHRASEIIELGAEATMRSLDSVREAVEALA